MSTTTTTTTTTAPTPTQTPESNLLSLLHPAASTTPPGSITIPDSELTHLYNSLQPVKPSFLLGEWNGGSFDTGHPAHQKLTGLNWAGKSFRSVDEADPIVVWVDDDDGAGGKKKKRVKMEEWGGASLREMVFRGVTSTTMVYDNKPIFDHFRYVSEEIVVGAMDAPKVMGPGTYYFYLTRLKE